MATCAKRSSMRQTNRNSVVSRGLRILGFASEQLREVPSDADFRLPVADLEAAIAEDKAAGKRPFCVVATAGTTNTGAVDPLGQLADLCEREGLWLHVDGRLRRIRLRNRAPQNGAGWHRDVRTP